MKIAKILLPGAFISNLAALIGGFIVFSQMRQTYAELGLDSPSEIPLITIGVLTIASFLYWLFIQRKSGMKDDSLSKIFGIILIILPWLVVAYLAVFTISPLYDALGGLN